MSIISDLNEFDAIKDAIQNTVAGRGTVLLTWRLLTDMHYSITIHGLTVWYVWLFLVSLQLTFTDMMLSPGWWVQSKVQPFEFR